MLNNYVVKEINMLPDGLYARVTLIPLEDNSSEIIAMYFTDGEPILHLVNEEVSCHLRTEVYNGIEQLFISRIVVKETLKVVNADAPVKLYTEEDELVSGLTDLVAVPRKRTPQTFLLFCTAAENKESKSAFWVEYSFLDGRRKPLVGREFEVFSENLQPFLNQVVEVTGVITSYGITVETITPLSISVSAQLSDKVVLAKHVLLDIFTNNKYLNIKAIDIINEFEKNTNTFPNREQGYVLCEIALKINIIKSLGNSIKGLDTDLLEACALLEHVGNLHPNYDLLDKSSSRLAYCSQKKISVKDIPYMTTIASDSVYKHVQNIAGGIINEGIF